MQLPLALLLLPVALATPLNPDAKSPTSPSASITKRGEYVNYEGDPSAFPDPSAWITWEDMWSQNQITISQVNGGEIASIIKESILTVADIAKTIDARVILGTIMQESSGNVHVKTTVSPDGSVRNPGLMQSHNGAEFSDADPKGSILQMIKDGTLGTLDKEGGGNGLVQCLSQNSQAQYGDKNIYLAMRCYNSGSVDKNNLNDAMGATTGYVRDIANRLMGAAPN
jgi:hypothetical protein